MGGHLPPIRRQVDVELLTPGELTIAIGSSLNADSRRTRWIEGVGIGEAAIGAFESGADFTTANSHNLRGEFRELRAVFLDHIQARIAGAWKLTGDDLVEYQVGAVRRLGIGCLGCAKGDYGRCCKPTSGNKHGCSP